MVSIKNLMRNGAGLALPLFLFLFLSVQSTWAAPLVQDQGPNRAGLVVVHGDGRVLLRCVSFEEPQITGLALLQRSGLGFLTESGPMGSTICSLDGEGCPSSDCWCKCKGTPCAYWNYFNQNADGSWFYSGTGASMRTLGNGDVDGWVWGDGSQAPPVVSFEAICDGAVAAGNPTPKPSPDLGPTHTPSKTPVPSATATTTPSVTPTPTSTSASAQDETPAPTITSGTSTATLTSTPQATDTPEPTATAAMPTAKTVTRTMTPGPTLAPTPVDQVTEPEVEESIPNEYLAFLALLGIVGIAFFLLRSRRRA